MKKKGNLISDGLLVLVVLIVFSIVGVVAHPVFTDLNTDFQAEADNIEAKTELDDLHTRFPSVLDGLFIFILILIWGVTIVASFMLDAHPIFFIFAMILLVALVFVGATLANTYEELATDTLLGNSNFPMTNFVLSHIVAFIMAMTVTIGAVLYGKNKYR